MNQPVPAKAQPKPSTYTARFSSGEIIYANRPQGNLIGELPLGAFITHADDDNDIWRRAYGETASGRKFIVSRD